MTRFRQGALVLPRMLVCVEETSAGPLGAGAGRVAVTSRRGNLDKAPWASLPSISAPVDPEFIFDTYLGENILPFRLTKPLRAVLPISDDVLLNATAISAEPDLDSWWSQAERLWIDHAKVGSVPLHERIDHMGQLSAQLGPRAPYRVIYPKAGNRLAAGIVTDTSAVIDHKAYWAPAQTIAEARYLEAVLNAPEMLERIKPLQAIGLFGGRDFDKYPFLVPFDAFNMAKEEHMAIVHLAERAEAVAGAVDLSAAKTFQAARTLVDRALEADGIAAELAVAVNRILPTVDVAALV